jgi:CRP-like cAMP-binding protein
VWKDRHSGEVKVKAGDVGDSLYVVLSGELEASVNGPEGRILL